MALLRRFLVTSIGSLAITAVAVGVTALQEVTLRATIVARDSWLRRALHKKELDGAALERQKLVWACSINASMVAELVSIVLAGVMTVAFERHRFAVNFGYADPVDAVAVFTSVAMQLAAEWPVDVAGLRLEQRQGLPVLRHFERFVEPRMLLSYLVGVLYAIHATLWAYKTAPNFFLCDADDPCTCDPAAGFELYASVCAEE